MPAGVARGRPSIRSFPTSPFRPLAPFLPADRHDFESIAAAVAHESGTTLSIAASAVRLARRDADDDTDLAELLDAAARNIRLTDLQLSRLDRIDEPEVVRIQREPVDLADLTRDLVHDLGLTVLEDHPTEVNAPDEVTVEVDGDLVALILYNLLANAGRHTDPGTLVAVDLEEDDGAITVTVRDQGSGVAPEMAERVFERYERDESGGGAGLGLAVSRDAARAHGGDLELVPRSSGGAAFRLTLPREHDG